MWLCRPSVDRKSLKAEPAPVEGRLVLKAGWLWLPIEQEQDKWQLLLDGLGLWKVHSLQGFAIHTPENAFILPETVQV